MKAARVLILYFVSLTVVSYSYAKPATAHYTNMSQIADRHLTGFNSISVSGSFDVFITQGPNESVKVEAPADMMDRIKTEVSDGVLKIYNKNENWNLGEWFNHPRKVAVYVTVKTVNAVSLSGSGDVYFKNGISAASLKLRVSGSGDMTGRVEAKILESSISGSGDLRLSGHAESSTTSVVGSGDFSARSLLTVNSAVRITGSGDAEINASEKLDAAVRGSGDIRYSGTVKNVSSSKTGSGDITRF